MDVFADYWNPAAMSEKITSRLKRKPRHFIREWRKFRKMTQEELAGRCDISPSAISLIENYKSGWTDGTLSAFADALNCSPGDLLTRNPLAPGAPWPQWEALSPEKQRMAIRLLSLLDEDADEKATGTDG